MDENLKKAVAAFVACAGISLVILAYLYGVSLLVRAKNASQQPVAEANEK